MISFRYDAPEYSCGEIAEALGKAAKRGIVQDAYSIGGEIEELESEMAALLCKERAVFMPTGTLANHLAIRALAQRGDRVLVQEQSHMYQDSGDALSRLSGFSLIPLGHHRAGYTCEEARSAYADALQTRVKTGVGALAIENPVRRCHGETFDYGEMLRITAWAREKKIGTHLDGARLFIASHYTKVAVRDYASSFDTVYVSLYKYFGSPSGAVLAGPGDLLDGIYHERRMFGGGLNQAWIFASLALESLQSFDAQFSEAVRISEDLIDALANSGVFLVDRIQRGSNIFGLKFSNRGSDPGRHARFMEGLRKKNILMPEAAAGEYFLKVNTSLLGFPPEGIAADFIDTARES